MADDLVDAASDEPAEDDFSKSSSELDHDALLRRIKNWFKEDAPHCRGWHDVAKKEFDFRSGDQWDEADKMQMGDSKRPTIVFNRIDPIIDAVIGSEIVNRQEVRYIPRQVSDAPVNEVLSEAARWFRDECDAEHEESSAFADAVTVGMGWTETRLDYEENPDGEPRVERIDPLEMFWDASARKANLINSRRMYRVRKDVPLEECKARWSQDDNPALTEDSCYDATWAASDEDETTPHDATRPLYQRQNPAEDNEAPRVVTLVQVQWYERETYYRAMIQHPMTGQVVMMEVSEEDHEMAMKNAKKRGVQYRGIPQVRKKFYEAFVGGEILEVGELAAPSGKPCSFFNFVPITGKYDRAKGHFYGLVRGMEGPQKFANKWLSTAVEIMARGAKGGLMLEDGAVDNAADFERKWATPGANAYFKDGAIAGGRVTPKPASQFPADFMQMTTFAISSIRDVTGVNAEILGMAEQDQAASLEYQRRQSATVILSPLFDSLRRYRKIQGRVLLHLITEYLSDGRLVRIVGDEGDKYVPLIHDPSVTEYDVIVDDAPSSPSQKELVWNSLVQVMPLVQNLQPPPEAILALLDYSPVPASVVAKVKQAVQDHQANAPPPPDPVAIKAQEKQIELESDVKKSAMDMEIKGRTADMELAHKTRMANLEFEAKRRDKALEHAFEIETKKKDAMIRNAEARRDYDLSRRSANEDYQRKRADAEESRQEKKQSEAKTEAGFKEFAGAITKGMQQLAEQQIKQTEALHKAIRSPRERTLITDKKTGRAVKAIERIID